MPEQGKTQQAPLHAGAKAPDCDLRHHHCQPDQAGGDVQAVASDKGEECGQESAALRGGAAGDHVGELANLESDESGPEHEREYRKEVDVNATPRIDRQRHHPARVARGKQTSGLDRDADLIEQLRAGRTARSRMHEHCVGGKKRREHHDVAEEEDPEAVGNHDPLWRRTGLAGARQRLVTDIVDGNRDVHRATSAVRLRSS